MELIFSLRHRFDIYHVVRARQTHGCAHLAKSKPGLVISSVYINLNVCIKIPEEFVCKYEQHS